MKIKIQHFTLLVFAVLLFLLVGLWSLSLYLGVLYGQNTVDAHADFIAKWNQQAPWFIPLLTLLLFVIYRIVFISIIKPLIKITRSMRLVLNAQHPGNSNGTPTLAPGLKLLRQYFLQLKSLTKHDALTGLNNRVIFEERLQQAVLEGRRSGRKYAVVFIDINDFRRINRELGPYVGDGLLRQLSKRLVNGLRESDSVARLEKDNFALLLEFSDEEQITNLVGKIYQYLTRRYDVYGRKVRIGVSIGAAIYPDHGKDAEELALKADEALLKAQQGEWPVEFYKQDEGQADYSGFTLVQSLRQALENDEFKLVYQPVMDLETHQTSYFEALLRWKKPNQHPYPIEKTIEMAEKNQLIKPLTNWIIETACLQLQMLSHPRARIAINLSMIELHDRELPERIEQAMQRCGISPQQLLIEITEGQIMQDPERVIEILSRLSQMGISLLIDDFGTGQASLTYLKKLPVEKLKIDQSFVKDMVFNDEDRTIVEATIKLAHTLAIKVVAEGVETAETLDLLSEMGCDYVQGYYISRPIEQDQVVSWCHQQDEQVLSL